MFNIALHLLLSLFSNLNILFSVFRLYAFKTKYKRIK